MPHFLFKKICLLMNLGKKDWIASGCRPRKDEWGNRLYEVPQEAKQSKDLSSLMASLPFGSWILTMTIPPLRHCEPSQRVKQSRNISSLPISLPFGGWMLGICFLFLIFQVQAAPSKTVNVYCWAYVLTPDILHQFEKETGIKVNLDVYDSSEVMETKLFTGNSGYDVVVVTVWPYLPRQVEAHLYQPLQPSLIPNWKGVDPDLLKRMEEADPGNKFALPFIWGTTGFAYNKKKIFDRNPKAPVKSLAMLFDPTVVSKFADCGVMLIDSPVDVFPAVLSYLKLGPNSTSEEDLKKATETLSLVRPFIKKFQAEPTPEDLTSGNYCLVQGFSGDLLLARHLGKETGMDIEYVIPEEGADLWIDAFAIPHDAPHGDAARAFINFILRPDIIAQVTDAIAIANSVPSSFSFMDEHIRSDPLIYPSKEILAKLYVNKTHTPKYERLRLREWTRVKIGR